MKPITKDELHCTISQLATGKSPGPDGITAEFYKKNWTLISQQFTDAINDIHLNGHIPKEMKLGSIILIHKKHDTRLLKNYRPISLLNTDLKIYTKLLANRLKLLLPKILHQHQYARPEGQIHQVLTLLRDIFQLSHDRKLNHFFLSLDFEKAFDSIDHQWLFSVLTRYGFPKTFVNMIATLHTEATSEIVINGFRTPTFSIHRGVRQGDPLSLFLFLIAVEPFLTAIRHNNNILGIQTPGRFQIKALSYADDITITVANTSSVSHVFTTLKNLEQASGLKLNYSKTHGLHTSRSVDFNFLPQIQWSNKHIQLLGSTIGVHESIASQWDKCVRNSVAMAKTYSTFFLTMTAKALITKSKILPLMTYNANIYPLPHKARQKIKATVERYIAGNRDTTVPIDILAQPLNRGGYNVPDIALYCDIFFLRPVIDYIRHRLNFTPATAQIALTEYQIGLQLSNLFDLPFKNSLPHIARPNIFYAHTLALLKKYKFNSDQLYKCTLHQLYRFVTTSACQHLPADHIWSSVHHTILTNSLKTLNFRTIHEIFPLSTKRYTPYLDPRSNCRFCKTSPEKQTHIFFSCKQIQPVWTFVSTAIYKLDATTTLDLNYHTVTQFDIPHFLKPFEDHIVYLFTVTRQKIWNHRNNIEKGNTNFSAKAIITSIQRSIRCRLSLEKNTALQKHVCVFEKLRAVTTWTLKPPLKAKLSYAAYRR